MSRNVFESWFLDGIRQVVEESDRPVTREDIARKLNLSSLYTDVVGVAIRLGLVKGVSTKRGIGGGCVLEGRVYESRATGGKARKQRLDDLASVQGEKEDYLGDD